MSSYRDFASYYDILTSNIPYRKRGEYFNVLINKFGKQDGILVDLACGTGSLSEVMASFGYDVIGVDSSFEMLAEATNKKYESGHDIMYICQDMCELDLYGSMDICICALDSINHVVDSYDVQEIFDRVSLFLDPDGIFIFDVNTPYKHQQILANNTFIYEYDNVYCVWQNAFDDTMPNENIVDISLNIFGKNANNTYNRYVEEFSERAYTHDEILGFINKTDLCLVDYYAEDSFEKPNETTQRIVYVVKSTKSK